jgi:TonB family protein
MGGVKSWILAIPCTMQAACAANVPAKPPAPPIVVTPVDVTTTYIASFGHHYPHGQYAVVQVCVAADGAIASTRIVVSSTQKNFDDSALGWARQARYQPQLENGKPVYGCQEVRVEINLRRDHSVGQGADSALG